MQNLQTPRKRLIINKEIGQFYTSYRIAIETY